MCNFLLKKPHCSFPKIIQIKSAAHDLGLDQAFLCFFERKYSLINTKDLTKPLMSTRIKFRKKKYLVLLLFKFQDINGVLNLVLFPQYLLLHFTKFYLLTRDIV